jgi:hypothetical protein
MIGRAHSTIIGSAQNSVFTDNVLYHVTPKLCTHCKSVEHLLLLDKNAENVEKEHDTNQTFIFYFVAE